MTDAADVTTANRVDAAGAASGSDAAPSPTAPFPAPSPETLLAPAPAQVPADGAGAAPVGRRRTRRATGLRMRIVVVVMVLLAVSFLVAIVVVRQMLLVGVADSIERDLVQEVDELRALATDLGSEGGDDVDALFTVFLERNVPADDEAIYTFVDGRPHLASFGAPRAILQDPALVDRWTSATEPMREDLVIDDGIDLGAPAIDAGSESTGAGTGDGSGDGIDAGIGNGGGSSTGTTEVSVLVAPVLAGDGTVLGTFAVAIDPSDDRAEVADVVRTLGFVALIVLVAGTFAAWSLASRVLRPVHDLTVAARATGAADLRRRIAVDGDDELADLGRTYNQMLDRLEHSFHEQRAFLDDVAHEMRTPITIVRGHLELLGDTPDDRAAAVALMTDELDRMSRYVDDLLVVAKSRRPDFLRPELVDVADIVDGVLQRGRAMADRTWVRDPRPAPGEMLTEADPDRLLQAMLALVTNAVQHTDDGTRISVGAMRRRATATASAPARGIGDEIVLWVRDEGPGIAVADPDRLFERFSRGPSSSATRPEGTGLGLAIVAAIAAAHGGRASVDTGPSGSTFRVHLPHTLLSDAAGHDGPDPSVEATA